MSILGAVRGRMRPVAVAYLVGVSVAALVLSFAAMVVMPGDSEGKAWAP